MTATDTQTLDGPGHQRAGREAWQRSDYRAALEHVQAAYQTLGATDSLVWDLALLYAVLHDAEQSKQWVRYWIDNHGDTYDLERRNRMLEVYYQADTGQYRNLPDDLSNL